MIYIAVKGAGSSGSLNITGLDTDYKNELTTNEVLFYSAASNRVALPTGNRARLFAMTDCFIEFGTASVVANTSSTFFEAGTEVLTIPATATHIAAVRYTSDGGLYITGVS